MDQNREDYADLDAIRPRMSWYGSVGFTLVAAALAGGTLAGFAVAFGDQSPTGTWVLGSLAIVGPFALVTLAARRAGAGGRGRGTIRVCGPAVLVAGSMLLVAAVRDATQPRRGRPSGMPVSVIVGGPLLAVQWAAGALALLVAGPPRPES
jgi:hypothetical protein